jgi:hypothetical protein
MTTYDTNQYKNSFRDKHPDLACQRIVGPVQIGEESTNGDVMSSRRTWKLQHTMASLLISLSLLRTR